MLSVGHQKEGVCFQTGSCCLNRVVLIQQIVSKADRGKEGRTPGGGGGVSDGV